MTLKSWIAVGFSLALVYGSFFAFAGSANSSDCSDSSDCAEGYSQNVDLKQTVQFAIDHSPEFDSMKQRLALADDEEKSAFYRFFPSLDLTAVHGIQDSQPRLGTLGSGAPWTSQTTLSLTQNIYDNGETNTKYKIATLSEKQALLTLLEQKNKLSLDIISQFLTFSLNSKLVDIQEKQFGMMTKQYQSVSKDFYQGLKTKKDFLRFKTQVNRIEISLNTAKNNLEKSRLSLLKLMGLSAENTEAFRFIPVDLEKIKSQSSTEKVNSKQHYFYRHADLQNEINDLNYRLVQRKTWPEIFFSAAASYGSSNYVNSNQNFTDNDAVSWNALITLKYNFFDWGLRSRDADVAFLKNKIQGNDIRVSLFAIDAIIKELDLNRQQAVRNYNLASDLLRLEKDNLGFLQTEYRNGKVQYLDLVTGYDNLADAEIKFYSAATELESVKYTTLYHQGRLYEEILK